MSHKHIDPIIREQLYAFRRRRKRLLLIRGACAALVTLLVTMGLVAFLDWRFILSDAVRIALSVAAYGLVIAMFWIECLRALAHRTSLHELARLVEKGQPTLREHLLSAVELGDYDAESIRDSEVFRKLLQGGVSRQMATVNMRSLLSFKLVRKWVLMAAGVLAIILALLVAPGSRIGHLFARALIPIANLARVSSTAILILEPSPADTILAQGDVQAITVEVSDKRLRKVVLETQSTKGGRKDRVGMSALPSAQFSSNVKITREPFRYRVYAGDAITRWHSIDPRPRPRVVKFHKRYVYPAYSRIQPETRSEEHGDLSALEKTIVQLELELDQPVQEAALHLDVGKEQVTIPAQPHPTLDNRITVNVPLTANGTYRTHLVAAETGFVNKFSPQHEIRIEPDLMPHVQLDKPERDLVLTANEMVRLEGVAHDDIGLAKVTQSFRVNKGHWKHIVMSEAPVKDLKLTRSWDLSTLTLKAGDKLYTKFTARDLKGSRSESITLRILIGSSRFAADRFDGLEKKKRTLEELETLQERMAELRKDAYDLTKDWEKKDESLLEKRQKMLAAVEAAEDVERQFEKAREQLKSDLAQSTPGQESSNLSMVGQMLDQARHQALDKMQETLARHESLLEQETVPPELKRANNAARMAEADTRKAVDAFRDMLATEEAGAIVDDLRGLHEEQEALVKAAATPDLPPDMLQNLARKQEALADVMEPTSDVIEDLQNHVPNEIDAQTGHVQDILDKGRERAQEALAEEAQSPPIKDVAADMKGTAQHALSKMESIEQRLSRKAEQSLEELAEAVDTPSQQLEDVRRAAEDRERFEEQVAKRLEADRKPKQPEADRLAQQLEERQAKAEDLWDRTVEQLEDQAELEELRPDSDPHFVKDLAQAARALEALSEKSTEQTDTIDKLKAVEDAMKSLAAAHEMEELSGGLERLAQDEQWGAAPEQESESPEQAWDWIKDDLKELPQDTREALPTEAAKAIDQLKHQPAAKAIDQELNQRKNAYHQPESLHQDAQALNQALEDALAHAEPRIDESRDILDALAPSLGEQLADLAERSKAMEEKASAAAREADTPDQGPVSDTIEELTSEAESFTEALQEVKDDIRRDANVQDLASEEGRERARDDDTALAMLSDQPQGLDQALDKTEMASDASEQQQALSALAAEQADVTDTLEQLAEHFDALEAGNPEETRSAMRDAEHELGIHPTLEAQYEEARKLADLAAADTPQEILANLERELSKNEGMQEALEDLTGDLVGEAHDVLAESVAREESLAGQLDQLAQQEPSSSEELRNEINKLADAAREFVREDIPSVQQAAKQSRVTPPSSLDDAAQQADQRAGEVAEESTSSPQELAQALDDLSQPLREAQAALGETSQQAAPSSALQAQAAQASAESGRLADQAAQLADVMSELAEAGAERLEQASSAQPPIASDVGDVGEDLERAARHQERLQEPYAAPLSDLGEALGEIAESTIPSTQETLAAAELPSQGQPSVEAVADALGAPLDRLAEITAGLDSAPPPSQPSTASPQPAQTDTWLARALDAADEALYAETALQDAPAGAQPSTPQPSTTPPVPGAQPAPQDALRAAAQAQAETMAATRSPSMADSQMPNASQQQMEEAGAEIEAQGVDYAELAEVNLVGREDWAKLPPRLARELREARREAVSDEYRASIETYFKVLAERNRK